MIREPLEPLTAVGAFVDSEQLNEMVEDYVATSMDMVQQTKTADELLNVVVHYFPDRVDAFVSQLRRKECKV